MAYEQWGINLIRRKVWACLADATPSRRFDYFNEFPFIQYCMRSYWTDIEIKKFEDNMKKEFNVEIIVSDKDKINDIIKKVRKYSE